MAKVNKSGIFSAGFGFPTKPPVGLTAQCHCCFAELETIDNELEAKPTYSRIRKQRITLPGYKIPCPECSSKVFFPLKEVSTELYRKLNPSNL